MKFHETAVAGAFIVEALAHVDARGSFARLFCPQEFADAGIAFVPAQVNLAQNPHAFTLRGMHFTNAPHEEAKFIRCTRGRIFDVVIDIRPNSPTFRLWHGAELSAANRLGLFVPEGCAHGFLTLEPDCDVLYQMSRLYQPGIDRGLRWNDSAFNVRWPHVPTLIHPRDAAYPDFTA